MDINNKNSEDDIKTTDENDTSSLDIASSLSKYLPFILDMLEKVKGTAIETKWQKMHESIARPNRKLSVEKLQSIERTLKELKQLKERGDLKILTQVHQENKESTGKKLLEVKEIDQNLNDAVIEDLKTVPGQVEVHNLPEHNEQSLFALNNSSCKHHFLHHEHSYARSSCDEDLSMQSKASETSFNEPEMECDEDDNRLVIDETTVTNPETDDKNETPMEVNEKQSPQKKVVNVEESLPKDIAGNVVEESPSESRLTKSVRSELNRLLASSRELENVSTSRRSCFLKQVEVGYKSIDINRRNLSQDKKRTTTNSASETTKPEDQNVTARKSTSSKTIYGPEAKKLRLDTKDASNIEQQKPLDDDSDEDSEGFKGWERTQIEDKNDETMIIPYQCIIPAPPVNDFQLWIYKSICNIAFAKSRRGFIYKCLIHGCRHQTLVKEGLLMHLKDKHSNQEWNGFCNICEKIVSLVNKEGRRRSLAGKRILDEFEHMNAHITSLEKAKFPGHQGDSITNQTLICESSKPKPKSTASSKQSTATSMKDCIQKLQLSASISIKPVKKSSISLNPSTKPAKTSLTNVKKKAAPENAANAAATATQQELQLDLPKMKEQQKDKNRKLLRPWLKNGTVNTKSNELAEIMHSEEVLSATYKCMSSTCSFYTIDSELFIKHLQYHEKFTSSDRENYLMCAYCEFSGNSVGHLMEHFSSDHVYDCFQCNYCFYRSSTDFIVITHQNLIHEGKPNAIIECPAILKRQDGQAELELLKKHQKLNVPPIVCVFCRGIFFAMKAFTDHVANHGGDLKARCINCGEKTTKKTLPSHLEKCRGIGLYQCVYCELGTNNFELLSNHIANVHPSLKPVFCERIDNRSADGTLKNVSPSDIEASCLKNIVQVVNQNFIHKAPTDQVLMRNQHNVGKLKPLLHIHKHETEVEMNKSAEPAIKLNSGCNKIVAQMPVATRSIGGDFMSDLLKPLQN